MKAKPIEIKVNRGEGPAHECGKPRTVKTFREANEILSRWALTAPASGGYDKCDFTITYDNGDTYNGRIDLVRDDAFRSSLLEKHMGSTVLFYTGARRPSHMKPADYERFLAFDHVKAAREEFAKFHGACLIGDTPDDDARFAS